MNIFNIKNIVLQSNAQSIDEAIIEVGQLLTNNGYVDIDYIDAMFEREKVIPTYVGNGVAVPHGVTGSDNLIFESGIAMIRIPKGIIWNGDDEAKIIIGIAGKDGSHMDILGKIAMVCSDEDNVEKLLNAETAQEIIQIFEEYEE